MKSTDVKKPKERVGKEKRKKKEKICPGHPRALPCSPEASEFLLGVQRLSNTVKSTVKQCGEVANDGGVQKSIEYIYSYFSTGKESVRRDPCPGFTPSPQTNFGVEM